MSVASNFTKVDISFGRKGVRPCTSLAHASTRSAPCMLCLNEHYVSLRFCRLLVTLRPLATLTTQQKRARLIRCIESQLRSAAL